MKTIEFNSNKEFIAALDGKVYAICDCDGHFICDILEADFVRLYDEGVIINISEVGSDLYCRNNPKPFSDYIVKFGMTDKEKETFKELFGIQIKILNENKNV